MENFVYCTPTKLIFGKNAIEKMPETLKPLGKKILLTYGGGSIKRSDCTTRSNACFPTLRFMNCRE